MIFFLNTDTELIKFNGKLIFMKISNSELVKALNNVGVLYQDKPGNEYKLVYKAEIKDFCGEEVIVLKHFR